MIHEKKAFTKICPIISDSGDLYKCSASECMAWRWAFNQEGKGFCVLLSTQMTIREKYKKEDTENE